jgi:hypothetical protein
MDTAPDIKYGYPSRGERLGPGWQIIWDFLADGELHTAKEVFEKTSESSGLAEKTTYNLLQQAKAHHVIGYRQFWSEINGVKRKRIHYKRK